MSAGQRGGMVIRKFESQDLDKILALVRKMWPEAHYTSMEREYGVIGGRSWREWVAKDVGDFVAAHPENVFVTELDDQFAGFCSYLLDRGKMTGEIAYNAVEPGFQGRGVGARQMERIMSAFKEANMLYAKVPTGLNDAHAPARGMYEKLGFKKMAEFVIYGMKL